MRHHGIVTQVAEARTAGSFGTLVDVVIAGGALVLSGAGLSNRVRHPGLPRADWPGLAGFGVHADDLPGVYRECRGQAQVLGPKLSRLAAHRPGRAEPRPPRGRRTGRLGLLAGIITQNVDGLHQAAGASGVTELHGSLHRVICLSCGQRTPRTELDRRLAEANPGWDEQPAALINPDGDAVLDGRGGRESESFRVVGCRACQGVLKPDVVFFGENVPPERAGACYALVERASSLVVLGSSLTVMSGLRYVRHAAKLQLPVVIVNQGSTRGDGYATATLDAPLGQALTALVDRIGAPR